MSARLLIAIVNYRSTDLTIDCLRALEPEHAADPGLRVVVCENASPDDSVPRLNEAISKNNWGGWASCLPLPKNLGFSGGNNAAIRPDLDSETPADFYLLLNPDTVVHPGAVAALKEFLEKNPPVGIAGSRLEDPDGTPQIAAFRFPTATREFSAYLGLGLWDKLLPKTSVLLPVGPQAHPTDWVTGASMMVRREVFQKIGLLDDGYFLYFDEVDFCLRARRAGFDCWFVPQSRVVHLVGQSTQVSDTRRTAKRRPDYWFNSRRRYFLKNFGPIGAAMADAAAITGFTLGKLHRGVRGKRSNDPPRFLFDLTRHSVFCRGFRL